LLPALDELAPIRPKNQPAVVEEQLFQLAFALIPASGVLNDPLLAQVGPAEAVGNPVLDVQGCQNLDPSHLSAKFNKTSPKICGAGFGQPVPL